MRTALILIFVLAFAFAPHSNCDENPFPPASIENSIDTARGLLERVVLDHSLATTSGRVPRLGVADKDGCVSTIDFPSDAPTAGVPSARILSNRCFDKSFLVHSLCRKSDGNFEEQWFRLLAASPTRGATWGRSIDFCQLIAAFETTD
jgi:hypothetical protein